MIPKLTMTLALVALALLLGGGPAAALDDIDPRAKAAPGECPALTAVKYPWLTCRANAHGGVDLLAPEQPKPIRCRLLMPNGDCAAEPLPWTFGPEILEGPRT